MENEIFDVIIIGASLAGSYAAALLSQKNKKVLLIEKENSPCKRVCGEGLSAAALKYIDKIGARKKFEQTPKSNLNLYNLNLLSAQGNTQLKMEGFNGFGINRRDFDSFLFNQAGKSGATVLTETTVNNIFPGDLTKVSTSAGDYFANNIVIAAGKATNLCRKLNFSERKINIQQIGLSAKFEFQSHGYKPIGVEIFSEPEIQIMLTPLPNGYANISVHTTPAFIKSLKSYLGTLEKLHEYILSRLAAVGIKGCLGKLSAISNICTYRPVPYQQGTYLIGDSIQQLNPLGGMGMTHALMTADIAAEDILMNSSRKNYLNSVLYRLRIQFRTAPIRIFSKLSELGLKQVIPIKLFKFLAQQPPTNYLLKLIHHA